MTNSLEQTTIEALANLSDADREALEDAYASVSAFLDSDLGRAWVQGKADDNVRLAVARSVRKTSGDGAV